jgi:hypothetical protein
VAGCVPGLRERDCIMGVSEGSVGTMGSGQNLPTKQIGGDMKEVWEDGKINVITRLGDDIEIDAKICGIFAVHNSVTNYGIDPRFYTLTHIPTKSLIFTNESKKKIYQGYLELKDLQWDLVHDWQKIPDGFEIGKYREIKSKYHYT